LENYPKNHRSMKAIVCPKYGPPEVLQLSDIRKPAPQKNEILIRVRATTVAVADVRIRAFNVPTAVWLPARLALGLTKPRKSVLGVELSGEIEAVGSAVSRFKVGDEVFAASLKNFGAYAEYVCLPETDPIALKPDTISHEEAAALPIGARTALHFLEKNKVGKGQKVLIYGASGSVGTYAVQLARHFGAEVTAVCSTANVELAKSLGAHKVLAYDEPEFLSRLTKYDLLFLAVDKLPFADCLNLLKETGTYQTITSPIKNPAQLWTSLTTKKKINMSENVPEEASYLERIGEFVRQEVLRPMIDKVYPMEQIVDAHRYVDLGHKKGNVVITVN
jgi:NADPH:quinone reductase-like Zn-dependent oxidoreductase